MDDLELYQGLYNRELARRADADTKINVPITAISILFSLIFYLVTKVNFINCELRTLFYFFMGLSILFLLIGLFYLVKSYNNLFRGNVYDSFPEAAEIKKHQDELKKHYSNEKEYQQAFDDYLLGKYIKYATDGVRVNDRRFKELYYSRNSIILSMCTVLIMAVITGISIIINKI